MFDAAQFGVRYGGVAFAAPEPSTWVLMALGFVGLGWIARRGAKAGVATDWSPKGFRLRKSCGVGSVK